MNNLQFKIDGPILKEGVPLYIALNTLDNFQSIVDKSYLVSTNSKRISSKDRERYFIKVKEFRQNTLTTFFDIVIQGVQLTLPLFAALGPQNIWDYTVETYKFLKLVCNAVQNGRQPQYEFNNNGQTTVRIGNEVHNYYAPVFQIGHLSLPHYQNLTTTLAADKITNMVAGKIETNEPDIRLTLWDKHAFDVPTRIEKETVKLKCEIFDFNKYKNVGKLAVKIEGQPIPPGEYKFTIFGDQNHVDYIYSMLKPEVTLHCLIELKADPFGVEKINKLHITGVDS